MVKEKQRSNKEKKKLPKQKEAKGYKNRKFESDEEANTVSSIGKRNVRK